jgi:hypothetical protein
MGRAQKWILKIIFKFLEKRVSPDSVPRSGEAARHVDCFSVFLDKDDHPFLYFRGVSGDLLRCLRWEGDRFQIEAEVPIVSLVDLRVRVTHYYAFWTFKYDSIQSFVVEELFGYPKIKIFFDRVFQYFFNKKKLITQKRMDLLKYMVERSFDSERAFGVVDIVSGLYTIRWVEHPDYQRCLSTVSIYLESLVLSGDLRKEGVGYRVMGTALRTLEENEEIERRHRENVIIQMWMLLLAIAVFALTLVQTGIVRAPVLLDLSKYVPSL